MNVLSVLRPNLVNIQSVLKQSVLKQSVLMLNTKCPETECPAAKYTVSCTVHVLRLNFVNALFPHTNTMKH